MTQLPESSSQVLGIRSNYPQFALLKPRKADLMTMSTKFSQKPRQNYTRIPEQNLKHTNFSNPCFPPQIFPRGILNAVLTTLPELFSEIRNCFAKFEIYNNMLIFAKTNFLQKFLWTRRMQFRQPCRKFLQEIRKFLHPDSAKFEKYPALSNKTTLFLKTFVVTQKTVTLTFLLKLFPQE